MSYADRIAELVETELTQNDGGTLRNKLLRVLGCYCPSGMGPESTTPEPGNELLILQTLLHTLRHLCAYAYPQREDAVSLMDGLWQKERWRECLNNQDDTYCLAALCILLGQDNLDGGFRYLPSFTASQLCRVLNTWILPKSPFTGHPSTEIMTRALFGDPWYEFCVKQAAVHQWVLASFVCRTRPSFLSATLDISAMSLPSLETV